MTCAQYSSKAGKTELWHALIAKAHLLNKKAGNGREGKQNAIISKGVHTCGSQAQMRNCIVMQCHVGKRHQLFATGGVPKRS